MNAPNISVKSAPRVDTVRVTPSQTGVLSLIGATQWGAPQTPVSSNNMGEWIDNHGPIRDSMTDAESSTYLAAQQFFQEEGERILTTRVHVMANSVDPLAAPTGIKAFLALPRAASTLTAPAVDGERQGPFTAKAGQSFDVVLDEDGGSPTTTTVQNATFIIGDFGASIDLTSVGHHMFLVIDGSLQDLDFQEGVASGDVPDETAVTPGDLVSAFNVKMDALGFHTRMELTTGTEYRINVADQSFAFSTGLDALTETDIVAAAAPVVAILTLPVAADTVDLTTDVGVTTTLNLVFDIDTGGGVVSRTLILLAADFVSVDTAVALVTEVVTKFNLSAITTGIRTFTEGTGAGRVMTMVVDEIIVGGAPSITFDAGASTATFDDSSLTLDVNTTDTGVVSQSAPTTMTAAAAEVLMDIYLGALADASVESGSLMRITNANSGSTRSIRIANSVNGFADAFGFPPDKVTGTDAVAGVSALDVTGKHEGLFGNGISVAVTQPVSEEAGSFDLEVYLDDILKFTLTDLQMDAVLLATANASQKFVDLSIPIANASNLSPDIVTATPLAGGTDGDSLTDSATAKAWYIGTRDNKQGAFSIIDVDDREFPDGIVSPNLPAEGVGTDGTDIQNSLCQFVQREDMKERTQAYVTFATGRAVEQVLTIIKANAAMTTGDLVFNIHVPGVIDNPDARAASPYGSSALLTIPGSPTYAGMVSHGDRSHPGGIHRAVAGVQDGRGVSATLRALEHLPGQTRPETADERVRRRLAAFRVIYAREEGQVVIDDVLVSGTDGNYDSVPARRGHTLMLQLMRRALKSVQFRSIDDDTIAQGKSLLEAILVNMMNDGGFASKNRTEAFLVDGGPGVNTDATRDAGELIYRISTAPVKPARFVTVTVTNL